MVPTMLVVGLVVGRWWAIPLGGVVWAVIVAFAVPIAPGDVVLAAALGAANVAVGVLFRTTGAWIAHSLRARAARLSAVL